MLQIIVAWVKDRLTSSDVEVVENMIVSPWELGHRFQRDHFEKLFNGISDWPSIEFLDAYGEPIASISDVSHGPDGGIDAIIRIVTRTDSGARNVAARIRKMIVSRSF